MGIKVKKKGHVLPQTEVTKREDSHLTHLPEIQNARDKMVAQICLGAHPQKKLA